MLPFDNDFLARLAIYPYVVLTVIALHALARECGAPAPLATLIALMTGAAPVIVQPALVNSLLDPVMYAALAAGLLFLIRHHKHGSRADLALAGLALGICFGTKFYGYTTVTAIAVVWAAARLLAGVPRARVARQAAALAAIVLAAGGIWMLRNWVETGNPLMPLKIDPLGITIFDAPPDQQRPFFGQTLASYFDQPSVWIDTLAHQFRIAIGLPLIVVAAGVVAAASRSCGAAGGPGAGGGDRSGRDRRRAVARADLCDHPYTAPGLDGPDAAAINVRYGIPAMIAAVPALAWLAGRSGRACRSPPRWSRSSRRSTRRVGTTTWPAVVYASFAAAALIVALVVGGARAARSGSPNRVPAAVALAAAVVALVVLTAAGDRLQSSYNDSRYRDKDPVIDYVSIAVAKRPSASPAPGRSTASSRPTRRSEPGSRTTSPISARSRTTPCFAPTPTRTRSPPPSAAPTPTCCCSAATTPSSTRRRRPGDERRAESWARDAGYRPVAESERFLLLERVSP